MGSTLGGRQGLCVGLAAVRGALGLLQKKLLFIQRPPFGKTSTAFAKKSDSQGDLWGADRPSKGENADSRRTPWSVQ